MAEHNSVLTLLKDGKLSEKPYAGGKSDIWQDFIQATHSPDTSDDCTSIICHCFGICYILNLTSSLLIYRSFIIDKMCYQAE